MDVLIQAQVRFDKEPWEFNSTSVRLQIPDFLSEQDQWEMLEAGRRLAWMRLWKFVEKKS